MTLQFNKSFEPRHGEAVPVAPNVLRVTCNNPNPFTFHGTNSYIVGREELAIIDPGPEDENHLQALLRAVGGRPVRHILVSHTHRDHSPLAARLAGMTGADIRAADVRREPGPPHPDESNPLRESYDVDFAPDVLLGEGDVVTGEGWDIGCILTPGHAADHACFFIEGTGIVFSADHVMGWSTSVVAPPDGSMADYMASLDKMLAREDDRLYLPGHGGPIENPAPFVRGLKAHRRMRERAILERIKAGDRTVPDIVAAIYRDTDPRLHKAAGMSVLAHLHEMVAKGDIAAEGPVGIDAVYVPAG